jgi:lysozyme family protein
MITNLPTALGYITGDEGEELNVSPDEPGGASKWGVTLTDLSEVRGRPCTVADVAALTQNDASQIYGTRFAKPIYFDDLPGGLDYRMLDCAVTLGVTGAIEALQMCLAIWPTTGVMDAPTLAAVKAATPAVLVLQLDAAWLTWKRGLTATGWQKYGHGWVNRVLKVRARLPAMMGKQT